MIVISSLLAMIFGFSLGFVFDNALILVVVACIAPCFFWAFKLHSQSADASEAIHSNSRLPASIFKSEFDDVEFAEDRERSSRKKNFVGIHELHCRIINRRINRADCLGQSMTMQPPGKFRLLSRPDSDPGRLPRR